MSEEESNFHVRVFGPLLFLPITVIATYSFFANALSLVSDIVSLPTAIYFNKGAMYLLGGAISTFCLFLGVLYFSLFNKKIDKKRENLLVKGMIGGVIIMVLLPQVAHFSTYLYVNKRDYSECKEAEYSWLLYKKYVYKKNYDICKNLSTEITKISSGR